MRVAPDKKIASDGDRRGIDRLVERIGGYDFKDIRIFDNNGGTFLSSEIDMSIDDDGRCVDAVNPLELLILVNDFSGQGVEAGKVGIGALGHVEPAV